MKIGIISTGDELMRGAITDTNAAWMAAEFYERGFVVERIEVVGDDIDHLDSVFKRAFSEFNLVIVSGGLGPTDDDLTAVAVARSLGCSIARDQNVERQVEEAFKRMKRPMVELNRKQADLPCGANVLKNNFGTAPGFSVRTAKGLAVFLPGVPRELKPMFEQYVLSTLPVGVKHNRAVFKCFGRGESDIQEAVKPIAIKYAGLRWSFRAFFPEICVSITTSSDNELERASQEIRNVLKKNIFAEEEIDLPNALGRALLAGHLTAATAESCTGGLVGHAITEIPGSSAYFRGGIIAYENNVKKNLLGVEEPMLESFGAVSEPVVRAMAAGVKSAMQTDLGIAVSGIAGPTGGTPEKPIGLVHFAVAHPKGVDHMKRIFHGLERSRIKQLSAWTAMWMAFCAVAEDR